MPYWLRSDYGCAKLWMEEDKNGNIQSKLRIRHVSDVQYLVQKIDENGTVIDENVSGFPLTQDGAYTVLRMMTKKYPKNIYIVVPQ